MLGRSAISDFISSLHIFSSGNARNLIPFALNESHIERFVANTQIIEEHASSNDLGYVIMSGEVDVYIEGEKIAALGAWEIFGEYAPIVQRSRTATVIASTDLTCLVLQKWVLLRLVAAGSGLNRIIMRRIKENKEKNRGVFKACHH